MTDASLTSWIDVPAGHDFPLANLPFGIFSTPQRTPRPGMRLGEVVVDLDALLGRGHLEGLGLNHEVLTATVLNPLMRLGKPTTVALRERVQSLMSADNPALRDNPDAREACLVPVATTTMHMPVEVGDYTDFYSSEDHARNVGKMFRDPDNALLPNWKHMPVGYHGRASSIVLSGTPIRRPHGQTRPNEDQPPVFGPSRLLDFELEMAFVTFDGKPLGERISTAEAEDYMFGLVLFNDWSARDIQKWEYVPLGPFLGKNFGSSISPWIVTLEALDHLRVAGPTQDPAVLDYLQYHGDSHYDVPLEVEIIPDGASSGQVVCRSNFRHMYWNMRQQLAHHTVNGCNLRAGDMMASGTISGPEPGSFGSMLEISWRGTQPVAMPDGSERKFILDGDTVVMRAPYFGSVSTRVIPA
ncbi:MAG: fumarylacetoacetase [Bacteroidetes bacterium]|nr:fumarylacetoacetase [Bacteroidota bacterium]MDA0904669.1 fumarylacetoacetase [Bacteroidota bacterium]MDA1242630.1 fumarylacetoacetase [Bacteroidota bacterium]